MLQSVLILLVLTFADTGCVVEEIYHPVELTSVDRESVEREKREILKLEEVQI